MKWLGISLMLLLPVAGIHAVPIKWDSAAGGNDHWYEAISYPSGITWESAKSNSQSSVFRGITGHLAAITNQAENNFIWNTFGTVSFRNYWLGGFHTTCTPEPVCG